ncbi:hypothetical protein REPUB_Repub09cG0188200 [Reevesia pubescens]
MYLDNTDGLTEDEKVLKLHTIMPVFSNMKWKPMDLQHPATFDTLAIDPELKQAILDDLNRFISRKNFYRKIGKAWKRGYLLYGPPCCCYWLNI